MPDSNTVVLSWDPVGEAETYNVYRSTSSTDGPSGTPLNTGLSDPSYQDPDAENGTTYYYRVTAVDSAENESDASGEVSATPFTHPTALAGQSADSQVVLEWSEAAGAASYTVYRSTNSMDGTPDEPLTTEVSETTVTDTSAVNGTKYYYRVTAVNPGGEESAASNEVVKTPFAVPDRPSE
jgi:fibronectin type 3 domain-containing protein